MNRLLKILLIILGVFITVIGGLFLFIHIAFNGIFTGPFYDKQDLIENFQSKKSEIIELSNYINSKVPADTYVDIEFENGELGIFHVEKGGKHDSNWNLDIDSQKADSLLNIIGWNKQDLKLLEDKLDNANCISVASGNPVRIGWQRSGMGKFFYNIFTQNLNDSLIAEYNGGCMYIFYKDNVVLEYGGGAIGPQCFPEFERK
ncbi:hypothetical protein [Pontibacter anaerobius]|uniref:Uncharacterized protein n=1 Tax=Pontibacter anaerobius TaxID=2993940 RepID=A0ABT3RGZ9_9BACT|nr:hypothetical protein [Pontibacter anaerobius]MCX2741089.1 hypothetical protein [Pontibacter anaerobius]